MAASLSQEHSCITFLLKKKVIYLLCPIFKEQQDQLCNIVRTLKIVHKG